MAHDDGETGTSRVSDRVAAHILDLIGSGKLTPGQRLSGERQLAEELGVSRVSVRAALQALKAQGFLEAVQGGGTRVLSSAADMDSPLTELLRINRKNLHDLAEIRAILEVWAARRAAMNASAEDVAELERVLGALGKARGKDRAVENVNFHYALARASGSAVYMHIFDVIRDTLTNVLDYHQYRLFGEPVDEEQLHRQHVEVFQAIRDRRPQAAAEAMNRHLQCVLDRYESERRRQSGG